MTPRHPPPRTIMIRVIAHRWLCRLKNFDCLRLYIQKLHLKEAETCNICYNKILYKHRHAFFSKHTTGSPLAQLERFLSCYLKFEAFLLLHSFWRINKFTSIKFLNKKVFSLSKQCLSSCMKHVFVICPFPPVELNETSQIFISPNFVQKWLKLELETWIFRTI